MNVFSLQTYWHKSAQIYEEKDLMNMRMFTGALLVTEDFLKTLICTVCKLDFNKTGEKKNQRVHNMCINSKDNKKQCPPKNSQTIKREQ